MTSKFYAPSRKKRVSFATDVVVKPPPVQQRLRGLSLGDLDHGVSICRAAFLHDVHSDESSSSKKATSSSQTKNRQMNTTGTETIATSTARRHKSKSNKPIVVLERRLVKITREFMESSFELEVDQNEMDELLRENETLAEQLARRDMLEMGYDNLEHSLVAMQRKIRKYTSKIATLQRATQFFQAESALLMKQLQHSKSSITSKRRNSKEIKKNISNNKVVMLETIPEVHQPSSSAA
jgi:hypothetical protein